MDVPALFLHSFLLIFFVDFSSTQNHAIINLRNSPVKIMKVVGLGVGMMKAPIKTAPIKNSNKSLKIVKTLTKATQHTKGSQKEKPVKTRDKERNKSVRIKDKPKKKEVKNERKAMMIKGAKKIATHLATQMNILPELSVSLKPLLIERLSQHVDSLIPIPNSTRSFGRRRYGNYGDGMGYGGMRDYDGDGDLDGDVGLSRRGGFSSYTDEMEYQGAEAALTRKSSLDKDLNDDYFGKDDALEDDPWKQEEEDEKSEAFGGMKQDEEDTDEQKDLSFTLSNDLEDIPKHNPKNIFSSEETKDSTDDDDWLLQLEENDPNKSSSEENYLSLNNAKETSGNKLPEKKPFKPEESTMVDKKVKEQRLTDREETRQVIQDKENIKQIDRTQPEGSTENKTDSEKKKEKSTTTKSQETRTTVKSNESKNEKFQAAVHKLLKDLKTSAPRL